MLKNENNLALINYNIKLINNYLEELSREQINLLFKRSEDIIFFYGFEKEDVMNIIEAGAINNPHLNKLSDLYELTNALLFQLKYKMYINSSSDVRTIA
jgi:hypothetical protein